MCAMKKHSVTKLGGLKFAAVDGLLSNRLELSTRICVWVHPDNCRACFALPFIIAAI